MYQVINATKDHINLIRTLAYKIWPHAYGSILSSAQIDYMLELLYAHDSLEEQIENLHHSFILIKDVNDIVGFASFAPHIDNRSIFHLHKIYVLPSEQGKHVGKQMVNHIIHEIKNEGATSLQLNVNRHNKSIHFYKKQGFAILREEDIDIGKGYWMNDYVMEKQL
ncbi:MAG: GNAT family N-acetyltransferase [Ginsengibacter sp.]